VNVLVIRVLVFTLFYITCSVFLYCFFYVLICLVCTSVRTTETSENSIEVVIMGNL
jgi:hypothetical protein